LDHSKAIKHFHLTFLRTIAEQNIFFVLLIYIITAENKVKGLYWENHWRKSSHFKLEKVCV